MKTKTLLILTLLVLLYINSFTQYIAIDSVRLIPTQPIPGDSIDFVIWTTHGASPCDIHTPMFSPLANDTLSVSLSWTQGMLAVMCNSVDTFRINRTFDAGTFILHVIIPIFGTNPPPSPEYYKTFTVNPLTGIIEPKENAIQVYPNPLDNVLTISCKDGKDSYEATIYDINGRLVYNSIITNEINTSSLKTGFYYLKAQNMSSGKTYNIKFIKRN